MEHFNPPDDVAIEFCKFFGRNPELAMDSRPSNLNGKLRQVIGIHFESNNVPGCGIARVPVACDLNRVGLF